MVLPINDSISINVKNNTTLPQKVNMLGGTQDPLGIPPHRIYEWNLSTETYFGSVSATILISTTLNPTPVAYTVSVNGYNIQSVAFALNSLNMGVFQISGNLIYTSNDFYIYGDLSVNSVAFISSWNTNNTTGSSSASNQIQLPLSSVGVYNFTVDWGDGTQDTITSWNQPETLHTYAVSGIYTLQLLGTIVDWSFGLALVNDNQKILSISNWGQLQFGVNTTNAFSGCLNLNLSTVLDIPDLSATTNLDFAFANCTSLTTIGNINSWDTSFITSMVDTFSGSTLFNDDISSWNTSSVTSMDSMFQSATSFNQPLNTWNVSNVSNFISMFSNATNFNKPIFSVIGGNALNMDNMFAYATSFNQSIGSWNVSNVQSMSLMFNHATAFNQNISAWNVNNVADFSGMFESATAFNQPIFNIIGSNAQNMQVMFNFATAFNQNISTWNVSNVTNFSNMFRNAVSFNQPIGSWNVSSAQNMNQMFQSATAFNQNIGSWNISNVTLFTNFMLGKGFGNYSSANLDAIYNGWSLLTVQPNLLNVNFGTIKYTLAGQAGKNILAGAPNNWQIFDGGI